MKRNSLIMASVSGAAMLAVAGVAVGVTAADGRAGRTTLTAATVAPAATGSPDDSGTDAPTSAPATGASVTGSPAGTAPPSPAGGSVDQQRAGEIALARAGGGRIVEVEAEAEDGHQVWSVEIVNGRTEHEVDVDRNDGAVVKAEQEPVDDDDDRDDRDDDGSDD
ncbi:PepSY domain-containing protein [Micromonospora sp. NBC_01655]|uniref:PepSY domain-containing protein n=1 Tax=Micromonospora sp. NBC_01655 TaxID=2975983 RepID=UPI00224CABED|nr:PepSY domain-containing protein [Micromonospora sp. NBC_01655]MCX4472419.1 PepSY domain-containing protein [Micromonospora sp. NBC_01655]